MTRRFLAGVALALMLVTSRAGYGAGPLPLADRLRIIFCGWRTGRSSTFEALQGMSCRSPCIIKSGTLTIVEAKARPGLVPVEFRFILRRPEDAGDPDYYGQGVTILTYDSAGGHFKIHYTEDDSYGDAVAGSDGDPDTIPQFVLDAASAFETSFQRISSMNISTLPGDGSLGGDDRLDVYVFDLPGSYGYTAYEDDPSDVYIVVDNDFTHVPGNLDPEGREKGALKVTAAHELFHAFQFQRTSDISNNGWWMEASSVWMEDEVFPEVKDYLNYIGYRYDDVNDNGRWDSGETYYDIDGTAIGDTGRGVRWFDLPEMPLDTYNGFYEYGDVIWAKYLSENFGANIMKDIWVRIDDETKALQAISSELAARGTTLGSVLKGFRVANLKREYEDGSYYPLVRHAGSYKVSEAGVRAEFDGTLDHLSSVYCLFRPGIASGRVIFGFGDMPAGEIDATVVVDDTLGGYEQYQVGSSDSQKECRVEDFGTAGAHPRIVVIIMNNSAAHDDISFHFTVMLQESGEGAGGDSDGNGRCFIATAAFGGDMAPDVLFLKNFRDRCLLANPPGRAFVRLYYTLSPPIAQIISWNRPLRLIARSAIKTTVFGIKHPGITVSGIAAILLLLLGVAALYSHRRGRCE